MAQDDGSGCSAETVGCGTVSSAAGRDRSHDFGDADAEDLRTVRRQLAAAESAREHARLSSVRLKVVELNTSDKSPVDVQQSQGQRRVKRSHDHAISHRADGQDTLASRGRATSAAKEDKPDEGVVSSSSSGSGSSSAVGDEMNSSDDPDKVAYNRPRSRAAGAVAAASAGGSARPERPLLYYTTGDAVLRAGVRHAVRALGVYKMVDSSRTQKMDHVVDRQRYAAPAVFVVGRRPRRSVRLLLSIAQGAWVVRDTWLLDSLTARCWKPCKDYVPSVFPGVLAARRSQENGKSLLKGLRVGYVGELNITVDEFIQLVETAGGCFTNLCVEVLVRGTGGNQGLLPGTVPVVNQRWLPDSIARWECLTYGDYAGAL